MNNEERARCGRDAMRAGAADYETNDPITNAVDTFANMLHALHEDGVLDPEYTPYYVTTAAFDHFYAEAIDPDGL